MKKHLFINLKDNKKIKLKFLPYSSKYYRLLCELNMDFFKEYHIRYYKEYKQEHLNEFVKNCKDFIKIIVCKGKLVGVMAVNECKNNNMFFEYLGIVDEFKNKGIGSSIIKHFMNKAKEENKTLSLQMYKSNPAQNLYLRLGFEIYNTDEKDYYMTYNPLKVK